MGTTKEYKILLGGKWKTSRKPENVLNPYNGEIVGICHQADEADAREAVEHAVAAFELTRALPAYRRAEILHAIAAGIRDRADEFARMIAMEAGKPITDAKVEVRRAINTFTIAAEEAKRMNGELIPLDLMPGSEGRVGITRRFPVGPVMAISPFNFPLNLVAHKIAPALAVGNSLILKPASKTPLTAVLLGEVILAAGAPAAAVQILPCPARVAEMIVVDDRIKILSFTGSPKIGWYLKERATKKKVILELGGNAGVIVDDDFNMDYTVARCAVGGFSYSGQVCISVQRIFVRDSVYARFEKAFVEKVKGLVMGDPLDEKTTIAPMIQPGEAERVEQWVKEAVADGAKVLTGGRRNGNFFEATVLTQTTREMKVSCMEVFAPVVTLAPYKELPEAIAQINDSTYGLQAGIFTRDIRNAFAAFEGLDVGGVIVNDVPTYRIDHMPYGGVKDSGFGREGLRYTMEEMTELKFMGLNLK